MANVYANGLEISGKAVDAKTIAVMPDVCFTPPETPATPPGVPIPYPSFGMGGDTESGTSTVLIGGKTVNIKNKSDLSKTTGTEAGCAAKKGIITSKNTSKSYFNSWSGDVKFEGEPVIRMSDLATHNHGSTPANTMPWPHVAKLAAAAANCVALLANLKIEVHKHEDSKCTHPEESEHVFENQMFQRSRGGKNYAGWGSYDVNTAPCICMTAYKKNKAGVYRKSGSGSKRNSPHWEKTRMVRDFLKKKRSPTLAESVDKAADATGAHHEKLKDLPEPQKTEAVDCLKTIIVNYLMSCQREPKPSIPELLAKPIRKK